MCWLYFILRNRQYDYFMLKSLDDYGKVMLLLFSFYCISGLNLFFFVWNALLSHLTIPLKRPSTKLSIHQFSPGSNPRGEMVHGMWVNLCLVLAPRAFCHILRFSPLSVILNLLFSPPPPAGLFISNTPKVCGGDVGRRRELILGGGGLIWFSKDNGISSP